MRLFPTMLSSGLVGYAKISAAQESAQSLPILSLAKQEAPSLEVKLLPPPLVPGMGRSHQRAASKAGLLLLGAFEQLRKSPAAVAALENVNRFRLGIYCASDAGPVEEAILLEISEQFPGSAEAFLNRYPPKQFLKSTSSLAPAQLSIRSKASGPTNTFHHPLLGAAQALEQARMDLDSGRVSLAMVCSAFALEDSLFAWKYSQHAPGAVLCEGAAIALLSAETVMASLPPALPAGKHWHGIAEPLLNLPVNQNE